MGASKLKTIHIVIIGCLASILVGVGTYFLVIKKMNESIAGLNGRLATATEEFNKRPRVLADLEAAKQLNRTLEIKYAKYLRSKMPPISFQDRAQGMIALWKEEVETLGPLIRRWPESTGVTMTSSVAIPSPPVDPNAINTAFITIPVGSFTVVGDFTTLLSHIRSWNKFNRLVQVDVGSLTGPSPYMTLDYTVTVYIFPRGEAGQTIPMATAGQPGQPG